MTYQKQLEQNRYAQIALGLPQKYKLSGEMLWECAEYLYNIDDGMQHKQALIQEAVKWAKRHATSS